MVDTVVLLLAKHEMSARKIVSSDLTLLVCHKNSATNKSWNL